MAPSAPAALSVPPAPSPIAALSAAQHSVNLYSPPGLLGAQHCPHRDHSRRGGPDPRGLRSAPHGAAPPYKYSTWGGWEHPAEPRPHTVRGCSRMGVPMGRPPDDPPVGTDVLEPGLCSSGLRAAQLHCALLFLLILVLLILLGPTTQRHLPELMLRGAGGRAWRGGGQCPTAPCGSGSPHRPPAALTCGHRGPLGSPCRHPRPHRALLLLQVELRGESQSPTAAPQPGRAMGRAGGVEGADGRVAVLVWGTR